MSMMDPMSDITVTSASFSEGMIEITYLEKREQGESVGMMRTLYIDTQKTRMFPQYMEIVDSLVDMVDAGLIALRNPEPTLDPRKRFKGKRAEPPEDGNE